MELIQIEPHRKWLRRVLKELGIILPSNRDGGSDNGTKRFKKIDDGDDEKYLKNLDPTKWKEQDHYRVLGLKYRRFLATDEEVKQAYKKIVLLHHPDKKHSQEEGDTETEYFACITKAYQILGDPVKRRSYDSVDEYFDDEIPQINAHSKANFYTVFAPVFARNSRWSNITPVPLLGGDSDTKEKVEKFYDFWYNFDSWREYSYLDEEDKERGQDRIERKWIERQNKAERERRKKEEMKRIRKLVDNAYTCDPRIARFKEEAKTKKLMEKKAKEEARKNKLEEEERRKKEEELARQKKQQEEEEMLKAKREVEKKEKEVIKKQIKRERKQLESFFEENNYFTSDEKERLVYLQELNKIFLTFEHPQLSEFKENIISLASFEERKNFFKSKIDQINNKNTREQRSVSQTKNDNGNNEESSSTKAWSTEDVQLLIKAVNLFPAGTQNRWEVIAAFVNQHTTSNNKNRKAREVLGKAKDLNKIDMTVKQEMNKISITKLLDSSKSKAKIEEGPSQRYEAPLEENNSLNTEQPWTNQEQQLLEQALKTYPASDPERWSKIANCIPGRSKKECVKRYKELVELVKAKKAAKEAAAQAAIRK